MKKKIASYVPATLVFILLIFLWQEIVGFLHINARILPSPLAIFTSIISHWEIIVNHSVQTLLEAVIGLVIAIILGWIIALGIDSSNALKKMIYPLLVVSQTIPMIALAPLLLLWFGFDILPKVIVVVLYCFFPIVISIADGFFHTNEDFLRLFQSMGATKWQQYLLLKIPSSMPYFFSGLKIAATYAVAGAIVGEYVGAEKGLGIFMQLAANSYNVALVFAGIAVTAMLSLLLVLIVLMAEKTFLKGN